MAQLWNRPRTGPPPRFQVGGPLDAINDEFHAAHAESRGEARREVPVFVVLADALILFHRGERTSWSFSPRAFHVIKSVAHAPLVIFAMLYGRTDEHLDPRLRAQLGAQRERMVESLARLDQDARELTAATRDDLRSVLVACIDFLDPRRAHVSEPARDAFAGKLGPLLLRLSDAATQLQLDALDEHVEYALSTLSAEARSELQVVVAGDHQARARSLAMQYFQKRLREPPDSERRVTFAEGVADEQAALALVGTRRLDHAMARAFFGDEQRLQRDILGDSAHARLQDKVLAPIL